MVHDPKYPLLKSTGIDPRLIGLHTTLFSFTHHNSADRIDMAAGHVTQAMVLDGSEQPQSFSGYEYNMGQYEINRAQRSQDAHVLQIIPKYPTFQGQYAVKTNPSWLVVYLGMEDRQIHYCTVETFTRGSDGYGYENKLTNEWYRLRQSEGHLPKEATLVTSPAHNGRRYGLGVNLNTLYMSHENTIEDAIYIGETAAKKMTTTQLVKKKIRINPNEYPINTYGDDVDEFKFIPDIGERINTDGTIIALRKINDGTFAADASEAALSKAQILHDEIYKGEPDALIVDLDIWFNPKIANQLSSRVFQQIEKYKRAHIAHLNEIVKVYLSNKTRFQCSKEFNTLVTNAVERLLAYGERAPQGFQGRRNIPLLNKSRNPIEFIELEITYLAKRFCAPGYKTADNSGCKGIIYRVLPDEDMPVDEQGIRADLVISTESPVNRMNAGQFMEQFLGRTAEFVRRQMVPFRDTDPVRAAEIALDFLNDVNPISTALIRQTLGTPERMASWARLCIDDKIYMHFLPGHRFEKGVVRTFQDLKKKWNVPISRVTYTKRDLDGNVFWRGTTIKPMLIGPKYVYLLCKLPEPSSPGISHRSNYHTPMRVSGDAKNKHFISANPIRLGEDEHRIRNMDLQDHLEDMRFMCLQSGSQEGVNRSIETLLMSRHPTQIDRIDISTDELIRSNGIVALFHHNMQTLGIESMHTLTTDPLPVIGDISEYTLEETDDGEPRRRGRRPRVVVVDDDDDEVPDEEDLD